MSRRVLVTGGASGLGLALTELMVARGDTVLVVDLAEERPDTVPEGAAYRRLDVRSQQDWDAALALGRARRWGGLDVLVNNAGVADGGRIDVAAIDDWERVVDINLLGVARGCHTFMPDVQGAAQRPHRQRRLARRAGARPGHGAATTRPRPASSRSARRCASSWRRGTSTCSVVCPAFFRTNLHRSFAGKDAAMQEAGVRPDHPGHGRRRRTSPRSCSRASTRGKKVILTDRLGHAGLPAQALRPAALRPDADRAGQAARPPGRRRPRGPRAVSDGRRRRAGARRGRLRRRARSRPGCARTPPARRARRHARGAAVRRRRLQPHLPAAVRRPDPGA